MEFTKLDALRKKCCADDYAWFSYDITNQGGHKAFLAVKNDDLVEFSKTHLDILYVYIKRCP